MALRLAPVLAPSPSGEGPDCVPAGEGTQTPQVLALDTRPAQAAAQARAQARTLARDALRQALAPPLHCRPEDLHIAHLPGEPPRLTWAAGGAAGLHRVGLSISHAPGLSLVAWHLQGAVGVDVQAPPQDAAAADLLHTAALYLGPETTAALTRQAQRAHFSIAFAQCWARHEAALKCLGLGLGEYSPALAAQLAPVQTAPLALPAWAAAGMVAALAWRDTSQLSSLRSSEKRCSDT